MSAEETWVALRELVMGHDRRREVSEAMGMSFARVKALRYVAARAMTGRELATEMATDPPFITVIVDDLERRGLVERTPHPTDRRAKVITVTPAGRRAAQKAEKILSSPPDALRALPPEDLAALARIAAALREPAAK
ncbi:MAG TPA: MarR family transcriptional regulator [Baekduia sp.]